eukprot:480228-Rhodomonas_salina.5
MGASPHHDVGPRLRLDNFQLQHILGLVQRGIPLEEERRPELLVVNVEPCGVLLGDDQTDVVPPFDVKNVDCGR